MDKLYYIDYKRDAVQEIEYTRSRALSVSPLFYTNKVKALIALKERCEERANHYTCRIMDIEREIARELAEQTRTALEKGKI